VAVWRRLGKLALSDCLAEAWKTCVVLLSERLGPSFVILAFLK
jgi:hypothetical protein